MMEDKKKNEAEKGDGVGDRKQGPDAKKGLWVGDEDREIFQADADQEEAHAGDRGSDDRRGEMAEEFLAHLEDAQEKDRESRPKDDAESRLPGGVLPEDHGIDEVGSHGDAGGEHGGEIGVQGENEGGEDERSYRRRQGGPELEAPFAQYFWKEQKEIGNGKKGR